MSGFVAPRCGGNYSAWTEEATRDLRRPERQLRSQGRSKDNPCQLNWIYRATRSAIATRASTFVWSTLFMVLTSLTVTTSACTRMPMTLVQPHPPPKRRGLPVKLMP